MENMRIEQHRAAFGIPRLHQLLSSLVPLLRTLIRDNPVRILIAGHPEHGLEHVALTYNERGYQYRLVVELAERQLVVIRIQR